MRHYAGQDFQGDERFIGENFVLSQNQVKECKEFQPKLQINDGLQVSIFPKWSDVGEVSILDECRNTQQNEVTMLRRKVSKGRLGELTKKSENLQLDPAVLEEYVPETRLKEIRLLNIERARSA